MTIGEMLGDVFAADDEDQSEELTRRAGADGREETTDEVVETEEPVVEADPGRGCRDNARVAETPDEAEAAEAESRTKRTRTPARGGPRTEE